MSNYNNCALFIGVGDYAAYDASLDNPAGTSDLPGAKLDAFAFYRICTGLGIPAENLRILTAPKLDPNELGIPVECVGDATQAAMLSGLEWLAHKLAAEGKPPGLLTYSGHGDYTAHRGLVLCPSDTAGPNLRHAIPYAQVQSIFDDKNAAANLAVILDTCYSGAAKGRNGRRYGSLTGRQMKALIAGEILIGSRMIAACEPDGLAWRGCFSGVGRGALSWAAAATLDQWSARDMGDYVELDLSYSELVKRAQLLLDALDFKQTLVLRGRPGTKMTPFFHRGVGPGLKGTSESPTAVRGSGQVGPDVKVQLQLYDSLGTFTGGWEIASVGNTPPQGTGYNKQTECWALDASFDTALTDATMLTFSYDGAIGETAQPVTLTNPTDSIWTPLSGSPGGSFFCGESAGESSFPIALGFSLTFPEGAAATGDTSWYVATNTGSPPQGYLICPTENNPQTLTYGPPSTPAGYSWYVMQLPALIWRSSVVEMPGASFSGGASMTTMGNTLYLVNNQWRPNNNNTVQICSSTDGVNWGQRQAYQNLRIRGAPAISAVASDMLYFMYCSITDNHLYQGQYENGTWSAPTQDTDIVSYGGPALTTCNGILCLAYRQSDNSKKLSTRVLNDGSWKAASDPGMDSVAGQPSLAALDNDLFLAFPDTGNKVQIFKTSEVSTTTITWPTSGDPIATLSPPNNTQWKSASLSVWCDQLVLSIGDQNNNVWVCFSSDGVTWSGYQDLTSEIPQVCNYIKQIAPAIGATGPTLVVSFSQNSGNNKFSTIATTSTPIPGTNAG